MCVNAPMQRTPLQYAGGYLNTCGGRLALDWNAYMATHPTALGNPRFAGEVIDAQVWFRDPPAPRGSNLSAAVEFVLMP
jgi:hypothetical protein